MEYLFQDRAGVMTVREESTLDKPKYIRFITPDYQEMFRIADGEQVLLCFSDGEKKSYPCKYLDEYHFMLGWRAYHICEFAERMQHNQTQVMPFPEKRVIWSNINLDLKDWIADLQSESPGLEEEEYYAIMLERNGEQLSDERINLHLPCDEDILAIGDIGRWNGRRMGYKTYESKLISDCLYSDCDYAEWYVDREGEFRSKQIHHDGTNNIYYRTFKESADYDERAELMDQIYHGVATQEEIDRLTDKLGEKIGKVYGWAFPTCKEEAMRVR